MILSATTAQMLWPRPSLAGCLFGAIVRDTRSTTLSHDERFSHLPAGPFCGISMVFDGVSHTIENGDHAVRPSQAPLLPSFVVSGPQRKPWLIWNPGPVFAALLLFYPDAFAALAGRDVARLVDRVEPAEGVLADELLDPFRELHRSAKSQSIHRAFAHFEDGLELLWQRARPQGHVATAWLQDWGRSVVARAAISGAGRGARQIQRRVKSWTGLTDRDLQSFGRAEQLFARMGVALREGDLSWARLATDAGFSDQSHMTRRVRRDTGLSPDQLVRAISADESFWCYRVLGERY